MKRILLTLLIACFTSIVFAQDNTVIYQLKKEYYPSLKIKVEVDTHKIIPFILEPSRHYYGDQRAVKRIYCAKDDSLINYGIPSDCQSIYWNIDVKKQSLIGVGARALEDYQLNNGQWLISESTNFPRFQGLSGEQVCLDQQDCKPLPSTIEPFFFWVWGKAPAQMNVAGKQFEVFSDKTAEPINKRKLMIQLEPNFRYLNKVFSLQVSDHIKKAISIVLLERNDNIMKDAGGVAKDHVALVNYYTDGFQLVRDWNDRFNKTMLHEYVHLLVPCETMARWACESLADYYAYKALTLGKLNMMPLDRWQRQTNVSNNMLGMYVIEKKFWQTGNWTYYSLFYVKGAAFWNELDNALHKKYRNLDNYLGLLIVNPENYQTELPEPFVNKMIEILGEKDFDRLLKRYLY